ncbi:MAG: FUSC family protein [Oscillospiraceae bacterium]|nr:FUSC family protein [Oscillospiraceae bacterium]
MSEQTEQKEKKKLFHFKFRIRKEFFTAVLFMAVLMAVIMVASMFFGRGNGVAIGMALLGVLMTLGNDYTLEPLKNTLTMVVTNVGIVGMAFLGYAFFSPGTIGYIIMMTAVTLVTFFAAIYMFTSESRSNTYMPVLLSFSMLLYYPVYGWDVLIRASIYAGAALLAMGINMLLHKNKFRKKIGETLTGAIENMKTQCLAVYNDEDKAELMKRSVIIEKTVSGIESAMGTKMSVLSHWQAGHDMMRTLTILKRINKTVTDNYIQGGKTMTDDMYHLLDNMLQSIQKFENDEISEEEISRQFDELYSHMNPNLDHEEVLDAVRMEMDDFIQGEVYHVDKEETKRTFGDWVRSTINVYNVIFALKVSILAAIGVCITSIFQIPMAYMWPLYVGITAQPYIELGNKGGKNRIINTIYAVVILLIAFSITQNLWVHLAITVVLCFIGDMFTDFDFSTMMGTMMSVVLMVLSDPTQVYSLSLYRLGYIAAACIILQLVDTLIFPNTIPKTLSKQVKASLAINDKLRGVLNTGDCDYDTVHGILMEKRRANQRIKNTNRYAQNEQITAFLLAEEEWINRMSMINHRLKEKNYHLADLRTFVDTSAAPGAEVTMSHLETNLVTTLNEVLSDINKAEQLMASMEQKAEPVTA